jgi:hypothetical protein
MYDRPPGLSLLWDVTRPVAGKEWETGNICSLAIVKIKCGKQRKQ